MADSILSAIDELEKSTLGAILLQSHSQAELLQECLSEAPLDCFSVKPRQILEITQAILARGSACDLVMLRGELAATGWLDKIGDEYIHSLLGVPRLDGGVHYAKQLRRLRAKTRSLEIIQDIKTKLLSGHDLNGEIEALALAEAATTIPESPKPKPKILNGEDIEALQLPPIEWALYPIASRGSLTLIHGSAKAGKSSFALYCALSIAKGIWTAGELDVPKARPVLYVAYEDNIRRLRERLLWYNIPLGLGKLPAHFHTHEIAPDLDFANPALVAELASSVRDLRIQVLIIDTLSYAHRADENKAVEMQPVMAAVRKLCVEHDLSLWLIHHSRKASAQGDEGPMISKVRGSGTIGAAPDHVLLWGSRIEKNLTHVQWESKDARPSSGEWNVRYIEQQNGIAWGVEPAEESERTQAARKKVLMAIEELAKTAPIDVNRKKIEKATGILGGTLRRILDDLEDEGLIQWTEGKRKVRYYSISSTVPN